MTAPIADLMKLARWSIRSWERHPEYDDMLSEAYLAAWEGYRKGQDRGARSSLAYATRCASRGPVTWLRRWQGRSDGLRGQGLVAFVPLEVLRDVGVAGFEERVIERLERRELVGRLLANCTPRQQEVIYRLVWLEEAKWEAAEAMGISYHGVAAHWERAVKSCREWVTP